MPITMFDFDGPLAMCVESEFFTWVNQHPSVKKPWDYQSLVETGDWAVATSMMHGESTNLFQEFMQSSAYPGFIPTPGAISALQDIPPANRFLATARGHLLYDVTRAFLDRHFGPFRCYHFAIHDAKVALVQRDKPDFVIDDCYPLSLRFARATSAIPILFPKPTRRKISSHDGLVILDAEAMVYPDMPAQDFRQVCTHAWREIADRLVRAS